MLTEQRYERILQLLEEKKSITVTEIKELLNISESTVRRDIAALHRAGKLTRVFGGAIARKNTGSLCETAAGQRQEVNPGRKRQIAAYAASLLKQGEFIYLDSGTTTGYMLDYLKEKKITVVTNGVVHAKHLAAMGIQVILTGGELKGSTEAVVGSQAMQMLKNYHFDRGFFGADGVSRKAGFTTSDSDEALIKETAMGQCRQCYVLADSDKFGCVSSITFGGFADAVILTDEEKEQYQGCGNVVVCGRADS
ncbi:MAG: DeoR/GlpR family DNA-binding transcription regulator [Roseburia sp.]|nr:DeoR/GlpR family DNA-binding transcription regulator [Roseburia sp.]